MLLPSPSHSPPALWRGPEIHIIEPMEGRWGANNKGPAKMQVPSTLRCFPPSLFPSPPVWHPEVSVNVEQVGTKPERWRRKEARPFDWAWAAFLCDSQILSSSFSFVVFSSPAFSLHPPVWDISSGTIVHTIVTEVLWEAILFWRTERKRSWTLHCREGRGWKRQGRPPSHWTGRNTEIVSLEMLVSFLD